MDGYTLLNKRDPPPHTMEGMVGKVLIGKNCHAQTPSIYHLQLLVKTNEISEALPGNFVWGPLSECLTWVLVIDQYL